ncbi:hypothetical protein DL93DRAFT_2088537 [Clavulina sp. PMI_390]|nr:hypothetical protein DL93DRAFT_2088537 [Clavulina sp. PMI_390]
MSSINKYNNDSSKSGGDISDAFASMAGVQAGQLPPRFTELKNRLVSSPAVRESMLDTWKEVLEGVNAVTETIRQKGGSMIPQIPYDAIASGSLTPQQIQELKTVGTVIVKGAVPQQEALQWKARIQEYAKENKDLARGFPVENPQVWEFYHSKSQMEARTHPNVLGTQAFLLKQWHASDNTEVDLDTPLCYFDRLRIRFPGDAKFALGPHIDGGSVERWEDPTYWQCFQKLLTPQWKEHDPFDATNRIGAIMDMYKGQGACNVFRPWQGWLSMSTTRANEGTLQVFPNVLLSSAYWVLRPFFKPSQSLQQLGGDKDKYLAFENWSQLDLDSPNFPNSVPGRGQELNLDSHPHLDLARTMTSLPLVEPGDQVYWHCDVIHAVESRNAGTGDSSVMYIPAVPLTVNKCVHDLLFLFVSILC